MIGAYAAASTFGDFTIPDNVVTLEGSGVAWSATDGVNSLSSFFADVTGIVKPVVDAAPAGTVGIEMDEISDTGDIDGVGLVVIFDDPNQSSVSTAVIAFGAQAQDGDTFSITLADPFNDTTQDITMSLAIGYGFQSSGVQQSSIVEVNSNRVTSSAGGQDDCEDCPPYTSNGTLYTIGGLGDDPANPADPNAGPDNPRTDDELYTLDPFISDGDNSITVFSENPSLDDIVHLATFVIKGTAAVVGEGILLTPINATNPVGTDHTVTALVQDNNGSPLAGIDVEFEAISGPSMGATGNATTNDDGEAAFTWSSNIAGTDVVVARFESSLGQMITSNEARKTWVEDEGDSTPPVCGEIMPEFNGPENRFSGLTTSITDPESGIVSVTFTTVANLEANADGNGPFEEGDTYTPASPQTTVNLSASRISYDEPRSALMVLVENEAGLTAVCDPVLAQLSAAPEGYTLDQNVPNPVRSSTSIRFEIAESEHVHLAVYDVLGRKVATLVNQQMGPGAYTVSWDRNDGFGQSLSPGAYVYRLEAGAFTATRRLTLVR